MPMIPCFSSHLTTFPELLLADLTRPDQLNMQVHEFWILVQDLLPDLKIFGRVVCRCSSPCCSTGRS